MFSTSNLALRISSRACFSRHGSRRCMSAMKDDAPSAGDIAGLQDKFRKDPAAASATFSSVSKLTTGLRSTANIRDKFEIHCDEPLALGGTDTAPNPVELTLAALGSCQEITWKAYARATDTHVERVSVQVHGEIDLRGFFAVSEDARPGFHTISGTVTVRSSASTEALEQLKKVVDSHCPLLDMLKAVPIKIDLVHDAM